jgi:hypothetical protein
MDGTQYNWVTERSKCSLREALLRLQRETEKDVEVRNALRPEGVKYQFSLAPNADAFVVSLSGFGMPSSSVCVRLEKGYIAVYDDARNEMFQARITLNDDGECRFLIDGNERAFWQFRRRALDRLFFSLLGEP